MTNQVNRSAKRLLNISHPSLLLKFIACVCVYVSVFVLAQFDLALYVYQCVAVRQEF